MASIKLAFNLYHTSQPSPLLRWVWSRWSLSYLPTWSLDHCKPASSQLQTGSSSFLMGKIKVKASVTVVKWMAPATQGTQIHLIIFDSDATFCECIYQATFENCRGSHSLWCQISWGSTCDNQPSRTIQNFTSNGHQFSTALWHYLRQGTCH